MYRTIEELTMPSMRRATRQCGAVACSPPRSLNQRSTYNKTLRRDDRNFNESRFSFSAAFPCCAPITFYHRSLLTVSKAHEARAKRSPDNCEAVTAVKENRPPRRSQPRVIYDNWTTAENPRVILRPSHLTLSNFTWIVAERARQRDTQSPR